MNSSKRNSVCPWVHCLLRVELRGEEGLGLVAYAFVGAVVHVDEEWFPLFGQCFGVDGETVVLRCDETFVGAEAAHRLVVAAVSVFELIVAAPAALDRSWLPMQIPQIVACVHGFTYILDGGLRHVGIARTVGYEESVVVDGVEVIVPWHEYDFDAAASKASDNIVFDAAVDEHNCLVAFAVGLDLSGAELWRRVFFVWVVQGIDVAASFDDDFAEHGSSRRCRVRARVSMSYPGYALPLEPVAERSCGLPVGVVVVAVVLI